MKKLIKYLVIATIAFVVLLIGVVVSAYFLIDPNNYQDEMTRYVKEKTGRDLIIGGDIEKSIYPLLGVKVPSITLSNPPGFKQKTFFSVKEAQVGVKLMPIFSGALESDLVRLVGLELNLEKNANGTQNWDDLIALAGQKDKGSSESSRSTETAPKQKMTFSFQGIEIIDASISWTDVTNGQQYRVNEVNLSVSLEELSKPFDVAFSGKIQSETPFLESRIDLKTTALMNETFDQFNLSDLDLLINTEADGLPKGGVRVNLKTQIDASLPDQKVSIKEIQLQVNDILLNGHTSITNFLSAPAVSGKLQIEPLNPRELAKTFEIPLPEMQNPEALTKLGVDLNFNATPQAVALDPIAIKFDNTSLSGKLGVSNFAKPALRFAFNADKINIDDYLPPESEESAQASQEKSEQATEEAPDLSALKELDLEGTIEISEVVAKNLKTTDIKLTITGKNGKITIDPLSALLYQGSLDGKIQLDATQPTPVITIKKSLKDFQAGPFTTDLLGKERINGIAMFDMDFKTTGITPDTIMKNLNGNGKFRFSDGAISGINLGLLLRKAIAKIKNKPAPPEEPLSTDFALLEGTFKAKNGLVTNNDFSLMSPLFRVSGEGEVNLPLSNLNYLVVAAVANTTEGQGGKGLEELKDIPVPVRLKGSFTDIKPSIDFDKLYKMIAKKKVDKETKKIEAKVKEKVEEKLKGKVEDNVKDKLKGLFGR